MTVAETPGNAAVADIGVNLGAEIQAHVGRFTTFGTSGLGPGEDEMVGVGR